MPTMNTFTASAATSVQNSWNAAVPASGPAIPAATIVNSPATLTVVPIAVCGREKRHRTPAARAGTATAAAAVIPRGAPAGRAGRVRRRSGRTAAPAAEPSTNRAAKRARSGGVGACAILGARAGAVPGPGRACRRSRRRRASARGTSPGASTTTRTSSKPGAHEPLAVLRLRREQHPRLRQPSQDRVGGLDGADHDADAARAQHAVRLGDAALRVGPVLDAAGGHVAVERRVLERQPLRVAEQLADALERGLGAARAPAGAGSGRASSRAPASTRSTIPSVVNPVPAPASSVSSPGSSRRAASSAFARIAGVQNSGLTQRS